MIDSCVKWVDLDQKSNDEYLGKKNVFCDYGSILLLKMNYNLIKSKKIKNSIELKMTKVTL